MTTDILKTFLFALTIVLCGIARVTAKDLSEIINDGRDVGAYDDMQGYEDVLSPQTMDELEDLKTSLGVLSRLSNSDPMFSRMEPPENGDRQVVSKRPFCNGFFGCGKLGKRSSLLAKLQEPVLVAKRPFCNGFFGCGNPGKRALSLNSNRNFERNLGTIQSGKRVFCNPGAFGCLNGGKRSLLPSPYFLRLIASSINRAPQTSV